MDLLNDNYNLHDKFGGKTEVVYTTGSWKDDTGKLYEGPSPGFEVMADYSNETIEWPKQNNVRMTIESQFNIFITIMATICNMNIRWNCCMFA